MKNKDIKDQKSLSNESPNENLNSLSPPKPAYL